MEESEEKLKKNKGQLVRRTIEVLIPRNKIQRRDLSKRSGLGGTLH